MEKYSMVYPEESKKLFDDLKQYSPEELRLLLLEKIINGNGREGLCSVIERMNTLLNGETGLCSRIALLNAKVDALQEDRKWIKGIAGGVLILWLISLF